MHPTLQRHLDAVEPHLERHHFRALAKVLEGWSISDDELVIRAFDCACTIVSLPIPLRERHRQLHRFICDMGTRSHDG